MSEEDSASWRKLQAAIGTTSAVRVGFPEEGEQPLIALPGEIRAASPMDPEGIGPRLIMVLETDTDDDPWINACLIGQATEVASDKDVRLRPEETSLPFPILLQTDVVGPLFMVQLGPALGRASASLLDDLKSAVYGDWRPGLGAHRGTPIIRRDEARWKIKESEIATMHGLSHSCMEHLMEADAGQGVAEVVLDPALLGTDAAFPGFRTLLKAVSVADEQQLRLDVPAEGLVDAGGLPAWTASLSPDEVRALDPVWHGLLRRGEPSEPGLQWKSAPRSPIGDILAGHIAQRASSGRRAFRVLTSSSQWSAATSGGVLMLEVEGVGRIQVKPEPVEEAA
jgi:hypothetical protein